MLCSLVCTCSRIESSSSIFCRRCSWFAESSNQGSRSCCVPWKWTSVCNIFLCSSILPMLLVWVDVSLYNTFFAVMVNHFLFLLRYLILASAYLLARLRYVLIFISGSEEFNLIRLLLMDCLEFFFFVNVDRATRERCHYHCVLQDGWICSSGVLMQIS